MAYVDQNMMKLIQQLGGQGNNWMPQAVPNQEIRRTPGILPSPGLGHAGTNPFNQLGNLNQPQPLSKLFEYRRTQEPQPQPQPQPQPPPANTVSANQQEIRRTSAYGGYDPRTIDMTDQLNRIQQNQFPLLNQPQPQPFDPAASYNAGVASTANSVMAGQPPAGPSSFAEVGAARPQVQPPAFTQEDAAAVMGPGGNRADLMAGLQPPMNAAQGAAALNAPQPELSQQDINYMMTGQEENLAYPSTLEKVRTQFGGSPAPQPVSPAPPPLNVGGGIQQPSLIDIQAGKPGLGEQFPIAAAPTGLQTGATVGGQPANQAQIDQAMFDASSLPPQDIRRIGTQGDQIPEMAPHPFSEQAGTDVDLAQAEALGQSVTPMGTPELWEGLNQAKADMGVPTEAIGRLTTPMDLPYEPGSMASIENKQKLINQALTGYGSGPEDAKWQSLRAEKAAHDKSLQAQATPAVEGKEITTATEPTQEGKEAVEDVASLTEGEVPSEEVLKEAIVEGKIDPQQIKAAITDPTGKGVYGTGGQEYTGAAPEAIEKDPTLWQRFGDVMKRPEVRMAMFQAAKALDPQGFGGQFAAGMEPILKGQDYQQYVGDLLSGKDPAQITSGSILSPEEKSKALSDVESIAGTQIEREKLAKVESPQQKLFRSIATASTNGEYNLSKALLGLAQTWKTAENKAANDKDKKQVGEAYKVVQGVMGKIPADIFDDTGSINQKAFQEAMLGGQKIMTDADKEGLRASVEYLEKNGYDTMGMRNFLDATEDFSKPYNPLSTKKAEEDQIAQGKVADLIAKGSIVDNGDGTYSSPHNPDAKYILRNGILVHAR